MHSAVRVIVAIEPRMYREALAFHLRKHRPGVGVSLVGSADDLAAVIKHTGAHLVVANEVPPVVRGAAYWVEVSEVRSDESLHAEISADGYSRSVGDVRLEHLLSALDKAEEKLVSDTASSDTASRPRDPGQG